MRSDPEESLYGVFVDLGTDDDDLAGNVRCACADVRFAGYVVEMDPLAVFACNDSL